ncbi:ribonucleotide-diphosphate reductase subunit alpha [Acetobacter orientalis]|uniref:Ribonucleoside-diphosphate reductase n=1 Tax=Acetobacter orientalis TaxID=146474 RepID=A0A2Z5ZD77_9PROT|nr:ribonucleotide-diphosphate reductase subunit alpha [Acetobacter orientalis]
MVQLPGHHQVRVDRTRDALLTPFGKATLDNRYLLPDESYQDLFGRVSSYYGADAAHAQRIYDYMSQHWFMPATPVLSNGGTTRGLPISCFLNEASDSLDGIVGLWNENVWLASRGGGIGSYWGNLRSIGENVGRNGKTSGVIPFIRVMDSLTLAISQGSLRRGSAAVYLPVWHPEIEEFIEIRRPTGGTQTVRRLTCTTVFWCLMPLCARLKLTKNGALFPPKMARLFVRCLPVHCGSVFLRPVWSRASPTLSIQTT